MVLPVELPDDVAARVVAAASARNVSVDAIVIEAVEALLARRSPEVSALPRRLALAGIGESEDGLLSQREPFGDL